MRYTRQELKQDKFAETAAGAVHWTVAHRKTIISGVIALAVLVAVGVGIFWYRDHLQAAAAQKLGDALVTYNAPVQPEAPSQGNQMVSFSSVADRALAAGSSSMESPQNTVPRAPGSGPTTLRLCAKWTLAITPWPRGN